MHRAPLLAVLWMSIFSALLHADQINLKNGDRLSGSITKSDDKSLLLKTDYAGDVTIDLTAIDKITSSEPLHVDVKNGKPLVGTVNTSDGNLAVTTSSGEVITAAKSDVTALRSEQEQAAYEKSLHPPLWQGWAGGANVGFAVTRGNSETKSLSLAFTGDRKTNNDDISMYANTVYATNDAPGAVPSESASTTQAGARYAHDLTKRMFAFVSADFQTDALQDLNLRSIFGGGLGLHAIKNDQTTLDFLGGLNYTRESYTAMKLNEIAVIAGQELTQKLGASTVLTEKLYFFPDLNYTGQYRGTFNFGTVTKLSKWLGWQNAFGDIYVSNPPLGKKKNDILLTTGLNVSFTH